MAKSIFHSKTALPCIVLGASFLTSLFCSALAHDEMPHLPTPASTAAPTSTPRLPMQEGDILLEGTIEFVSLSKQELVLKAIRFTLPNGRYKEMLTPRYKLVHFDLQLPIAAAPYPTNGTAPQLRNVNELAVRRRLAVVGPDSGTGQIMEARLLELGELSKSVAPANGNSTRPYNSIRKTFPVRTTNYFGGVPEHVAATGLRVGQKFGIRNISGKTLRPGNPNSDHPRGLALDFMVNRNAKLGDKVAAYFEANAEFENVAYIIWKDQLVYPGGRTDWSSLVADYGPGFTKRHMDHVHVSFLEQPQRP